MSRHASRTAADGTPLRLGIIGMSEGNGHPFSWAAIINGYDAQAMDGCPFPAIPQYLAARRYPEEFIHGAAVTHVWTQDPATSRSIAAASHIPIVAEQPEAMIGHVDAVLLARDDAPNHPRFAEPFLRRGIPIYVDKPLALDRAGAEALIGQAHSDRHLFSCSALRYAPELQLSADQLRCVGRVRFIDAWVPKYWETYAIHAIEPVVTHFAAGDCIVGHQLARAGGAAHLALRWDSGLVTRFSSMGTAASPIGFRIFGDEGSVELLFEDSFTAFKAALVHFIDIVQGRAVNIPREQTLRIIEIIELGRQKAIEL